MVIVFFLFLRFALTPDAIIAELELLFYQKFFEEQLAKINLLAAQEF